MWRVWQHMAMWCNMLHSQPPHWSWVKILFEGMTCRTEALHAISHHCQVQLTSQAHQEPTVPTATPAFYSLTCWCTTHAAGARNFSQYTARLTIVAFPGSFISLVHTQRTHVLLGDARSARATAHSGKCIMLWRHSASATRLSFFITFNSERNAYSGDDMQIQNNTNILISIYKPKSLLSALICSTWISSLHFTSMRSLYTTKLITVESL